VAIGEALRIFDVAAHRAAAAEAQATTRWRECLGFCAGWLAAGGSPLAPRLRLELTAAVLAEKASKARGAERVGVSAAVAEWAGREGVDLAAMAKALRLPEPLDDLSAIPPDEGALAAVRGSLAALTLE
jgi:hypothetical protein